jgi:hypothetical protein
MPLTLENFRQLIDSKILERGSNYYHSGYVTELDEVSDGQWSAQVAGTYVYDVSVEQPSNGELFCECTCPYDWGPHCKHIAAMLYAIAEEYPDYVAGKKPVKAKKKRQTREEKVRDALGGLSRDELMEILVDQARSDKQLANQLVLQYGVVADDKKTYARMVRDALSLGRERDGFIDYMGAMVAARSVDDILGRAEALLADGKPLQAVPIAQAVVETVVPGLQAADDSNGSLGGCIWSGLDLLERAAKALPVEENRSLLEYFLEEAQHERYAGWDWGWELARLATDLISTPEERGRVFDALDQMAGLRADRRAGLLLSHYDEERAALNKLSVIKREDGEEAAHTFMVEHKHLFRFREHLIDYYLERGDLSEAKLLCEEWLQDHPTEAPGYALRLRKVLLEVARRSQDTGEIVRLARQLFLDRGNFDHYQALKQAIPASEWPATVEELIREGSKQSPYFYRRTVTEIYVREQMWNRLLEAAQREGSRLIDGYREHLEPRFPDEVCDIYERIVFAMLERTSDRMTYRDAAGYLRRMQRLGQRERVDEIVDLMVGTYKNRRAMIEELNGVRGG